jgi:hypothetical protein
MARHEITYACGHTGDVNLIGKHSYREWRLARLRAGECLECYKSRTHQVAVQVSAELELPPLSGSEKQVVWAETLRIRKIADIEKEAVSLSDENPFDEDEKNDEYHRQVLLAVDHILEQKTARWWIDNRDESAVSLIRRSWRMLMAAPTEAQKQAEREERAKEVAENERRIQAERSARIEATVRPENVVCEQAAELVIQDQIISVRLPEAHDVFKRIVKALGYNYESYWWNRKITPRAGSVEDRAIELGQMLLSRGFPILVLDADLRAKIVSGTFEPEQTRWILKFVAGNYAGWLCIQWGTNEDYYEVARKITGSCYARPNVAVPPVQFQQIEDFAERYSFQIGSSAQEALQQAREDKAKMLVVSKQPIALPQQTVASTNPPVLAVPEQVDVDEELKDHD